jgi:L-lactate dehydrogenase (cytochrome)
VIQKELITTMGLVGEWSIGAMGRHNLLIPKGFEGDWAD